jgi:class 3 adenylate cyclase
VQVVKVNELLADAGERARDELKTPVEIVEPEAFPEREDMYVDARKWMKIENVVAVVIDLKGSTALDYKGKHANTSARLYEAVTGCGVKLVNQFEPEFVGIQGDGFFALFHGERSYERALCAGITLKSFSSRALVPAIEETMSDRFPKTGLKVGLAASTLTVKRVGTRKTNEPVWAGKAVNWATKCAQRAEAHELIATSKVFNRFAENDYVTHSCGCVNGEPCGSITYLWAGTQVEALGEGNVDCKLLKTAWCENCGDEFCQAILDGKTKRDEVVRSVAA